jgi:hypothetical protein
VYPGIKINPFSPECLQGTARLPVFFDNTDTHSFPAEDVTAKKAAKAAADDDRIVLVFIHPVLFDG